MSTVEQAPLLPGKRCSLDWWNLYSLWLSCLVLATSFTRRRRRRQRSQAVRARSVGKQQRARWLSVVISDANARPLWANVCFGDEDSHNVFANWPPSSLPQLIWLISDLLLPHWQFAQGRQCQSVFAHTFDFNYHAYSWLIDVLLFDFVFIIWTQGTCFLPSFLYL